MCTIKTTQTNYSSTEETPNTNCTDKGVIYSTADSIHAVNTKFVETYRRLFYFLFYCTACQYSEQNASTRSRVFLSGGG